MSSGLVHDENLQIGLPAEIFFGVENTTFDETKLPYTTECLTGICAITTTRTGKAFRGGVPISDLKSLTIEESGEVKITTGAMPVEMRQRAMGGGELKTVAADPSKAFSFEVCLSGTATVKLPIRNLVSATVSTNAATPVTISKTNNYTENLVTGEFSRIDGGAIDSGDIVIITGTYSAARKKTWSFGGNTNRFYYPARVLFLKDNDGHKIYDLYRLRPKGEFTEEFQDDWIKYTMTFSMERDSSRDLDDQLCKIHEDTDEA
jgi:hypothetical protein